MKVVEIKTTTGVYTLPLIEVARHRANEYYSNSSHPQWAESLQFVVNDKFEGIDWLINNTDFEDWSDKLKKVSDETIPDENFWFKSENYKIITL